ncbi:MAG TPA: M20/M25/M40 family metallo-hydrolase [Alphaproteobacteria bacterium]|jgi:acetylornithine deacetylase/succinyl-diaminopimelate desuccinylase-like protein|nr:M20/M25/M40 family metallo-hydrolase [Alphaproteobacteria bacterium]
METIQILQNLISIPSWVDNTTNERKIGEWIFNFLKKNSTLKISKQLIGNGRFNIVAQNGQKVDMLMTGHIDTVCPNSNWTLKPTDPKISGDKLYGRGSSDMKCGIAIMLYLATLPNLKNNIMFLFYCDEEYDFLGMKKFIADYKDRINPKMIISLDGNNLEIENSCRGLIEMKISAEGKAGHAANPKSGINAITESVKVITKLKKWLKNFSTKELGNSTLNIAYINGGGSEGNVIAEKCEYIVEIRVANENLNADLVKNFINENSEKLGLKIIETKIRHDLGSWITPKESLKNIISLAPKKKIASAKKSGYIDIQMLWETFGKVPTFNLGAGENGQPHAADEYVQISKVLKAQEFYKNILTNKYAKI